MEKTAKYNDAVKMFKEFIIANNDSDKWSYKLISSKNTGVKNDPMLLFDGMPVIWYCSRFERFTGNVVNYKVRGKVLQIISVIRLQGYDNNELYRIEKLV